MAQPPGSVQPRSLSGSSGKTGGKTETIQHSPSIPKTKKKITSKELGPSSVAERRSTTAPKKNRRAAGDAGARNSSPQPDVQEVDIVYPPDPEPPEYVYKENINVADRHAKGAGAVYLVTSSSSDPGTIHIYLKGSRYLEYPVLSMFNYISSSTILCPQFKENDGVSIVTTSLVFASQEKMVKFMSTIKTLQARKLAATGLPAAQTTDAPVPSVPHVNQMPAESTVTASVSVTESTPVTNGSADEQKPHDFGIHCDLVDLSESDVAFAPQNFSSFKGPSTYAMDLCSLNFYVSETRNESFDSRTCSESLQGPGNQKKSEASNAELIDTGEVSQPVVSSHETLQQNVPPPESSESSTHTREQPSLQPTRVVEDPLKSLQDHLVKILPNFEAMRKILSAFEEKNQESAAKSVFAQLKEKHPDAVDFDLSSAEQLLRTLVAKAKKPQAMKPSEPAGFRSKLRYDIVDMVLLRKYAVPPPERLFKLDFLPRTVRSRGGRSGTTSTTAFSAPNIRSNPKPVSLRPDAEPFLPSPTQEQLSSKPTIQFVPFSIPHKKTSTFTPTALSELSNKADLSNMDLLTASMARLGLPDDKPATPAQIAVETLVLAQAPIREPIQGLRGSRWATVDNSSKGT